MSFNPMEEGFSKYHSSDFKNRDNDKIILHDTWGEWEMQILNREDSYKIVCSDGKYTDEWVTYDADIIDYNLGELWRMAWEHFDDCLADADELSSLSEYY